MNRNGDILRYQFNIFPIFIKSIFRGIACSDRRFHRVIGYALKIDSKGFTISKRILRIVPNNYKLAFFTADIGSKIAGAEVVSFCCTYRFNHCSIIVKL